MDVLHLLYRNGLVLALHAMACVAGFIAGSSLPLSAENRTGLSRWVHEKAGPLAIAFVIGATTFSLVTQAYVLGGGAATLSWQLGADPAALLAVVSVHALPELVALFLPLAAWMVASRQGDWHRAARGDLRHGRDRRARARGERGRRGLPHAPAPGDARGVNPTRGLGIWLA